MKNNPYLLKRVAVVAICSFAFASDNGDASNEDEPGGLQALSSSKFGFSAE